MQLLIIIGQLSQRVNNVSSESLCPHYPLVSTHKGFLSRIWVLATHRPAATCSPTRSALAAMVSAGFMTGSDGKNDESTT